MFQWFRRKVYLVNILKIWHIRAVLQQEDANVAGAMGRVLCYVDINCEARAHVGIKGVWSCDVLATIPFFQKMD